MLASKLRSANPVKILQTNVFKNLCRMRRDFGRLQNNAVAYE